MTKKPSKKPSSKKISKDPSKESTKAPEKSPTPPPPEPVKQPEPKPQEIHDINNNNIEIPEDRFADNQDADEEEEYNYNYYMRNKANTDTTWEIRQPELRISSEVEKSEFFKNGF